MGASPDRGAEEQEVEKQEPRAEGQGGVLAGEEVREGADPKEGPSSDRGPRGRGWLLKVVGVPWGFR